MLEDLKQRVCALNKQLPAERLVTSTSGNVSGREPEQPELVVIKPSGVPFDELTPGDMVVADMAGEVVEGELNPSVDLPNHLWLYKHKPQLMGVVHTHSNYATAFAVLGMSIPCCTTAIADEFGGDIPCAPYASNEAENIGQSILDAMTRAPAVLCGCHGVFAFAERPSSAAATGSSPSPRAPNGRSRPPLWSRITPARSTSPPCSPSPAACRSLGHCPTRRSRSGGAATTPGTASPTRTPTRRMTGTNERPHARQCRLLPAAGLTLSKQGPSASSRGGPPPAPSLPLTPALGRGGPIGRKGERGERRPPCAEDRAGYGAACRGAPRWSV